MPHWKHTATRCAMPLCERTRRKGWTTCALFGHAERGVSLYGLARDAPRLTELSPYAALERIGCECDPTDLRPDLLVPGVEAVFVENQQNPYTQDPDYDIWAFVLLSDGTATCAEYKRLSDVTPERITELAGDNLDNTCGSL